MKQELRDILLAAQEAEQPAEFTLCAIQAIVAVADRLDKTNEEIESVRMVLDERSNR